MGSSFQGANTTAKGVYRNLLKAVRKHVGKEEHKAHFTDFIKQEFRNNPYSENPQNLKLAHDYTFYLNSVHHHKWATFLKWYFRSEHVMSISLLELPNVYIVKVQELLFSYNIAVDRSDEMKKILGKSAASVGLQLPDVYLA
ncbi:hypothetical protein Sango_0752500 [Sesamum angolense]|uniref:Uncharacterized protein n=1 Tax=Sesamum angolense TaxID=2727404 RepID=A0AAE1X1Y4_9LAMI|nr:hypothetical protein Sango_0752500 [Sesamum angolense]